ncbi:hypothetical protein NTH44_003343 [Vibrio metoecus]
MKSNYFSIFYSASTVSGVLVQIDSYKTEGKHNVYPLISADEGEDYFSELSDLIDAMSTKTQAVELRIHPSVVANILTEAQIDFTYDELATEHLLKAVEIHINKAGDLAAVYQMSDIGITT